MGRHEQGPDANSKPQEKEALGDIRPLDEIVIQALDFFTKNPPPFVDVSEFKSPFVVGSGNALNTATILFSGKDAVFADESTFRGVIASTDSHARDGSLRDAVVISASGGKDSVWEVELAKSHGLQTTLLTTKPESDAAKVSDRVIAFQSVAEPYTYNTSTYMAMILAATHEDPSGIKEYLQELVLPEHFGDYRGYAFVLPDTFTQICPMLETKKDELFGPYVSVRAFSQGHARHAKFLIQSPEELVISLGQTNEYFGDPNHRWDIDLPEGFDFAAVMAMTYYLVGKIQIAKPPYYIENIARFVVEGPRAYGKSTPFDIIVPGTTS